MIRLWIEGQYVQLYPGTSITLEIENDLFNFESIEGAYSYPFDLPTEVQPNAQVFGYPGVIENRQQVFRDYEARLEYQGATINSGTLKAIRLADKKIKANLFAEASELARQKDARIASLVNHVWEWDPAPTERLDFSQFYNQGSDLRFPAIIIANPGLNYQPNTVFNTGLEDDHQLPARLPMPQPRLMFVLGQILQGLNYTVVDQWSANHPDVDRLTLFSNRLLPVEQLRVSGGFNQVRNLQPDRVELADLLPELDLKTFIAHTRAISGLYLDFDSRNRTCTIRHFDDILADPAYVDMTAKAVPGPEQQPAKRGAVFTAEAYDDYSKVDELASGIYIGTVNSLADLNALPQVPLHTWYVRSENRLYTWKTNRLTEQGEWQRTGPDLGSRTVAPGERKIDCPRILVDEKYIHQYTSGRIENNNGKVRLVIDSDPPRFWQQVKILDSEHYPAEWVTVTGQSGDNYETDLDYIVLSNTNVELHFRAEGLYRAPQVNCGLHIPELGEEGRAAPGVFLYHHGATWNNGTTGLRMAGNNNTDGAGNQHGNITLNLRDAGRGIVPRYQLYLNALEESREVEMTFRLDLADLLSFRRTRKWRIRDNNYFVKRIKVSLTDSGIKPAKVTLIKVS